MNEGFNWVAAAAAKLAGELPLDTAGIVADLILSSYDLTAAATRIAELPHPHYRKQAVAFLAECLRFATSLTPQSVALALVAAAKCERLHRDEQSVELAWTGPDMSTIPIRRTEQAILQVLDSARHRITLVSYAVYHIPNVREALIRAALRGVHIIVVVETPDRLEGENEYSTIRALGEDVANCAAVYFWPKEKRRKNSGGKAGILHVKCAVGDGHWLFLSSANLTQYAFDINMELGVLVTGGKMPSQVEANFDKLIANETLLRV